MHWQASMTLVTLIAKKFSQRPQEVHACTCTCTLINYGQVITVHVTSYFN